MAGFDSQALPPTFVHLPRRVRQLTKITKITKNPYGFVNFVNFVIFVWDRRWYVTGEARVLPSETQTVREQLLPLAQGKADVAPAAPPPRRIGRVVPGCPHDRLRARALQASPEGERRASRVVLGGHHDHALARRLAHFR